MTRKQISFVQTLLKLSGVVAMLLLTAMPAMAHSGGLDSSGGHHDHKNGGYHMHSGGGRNSGGYGTRGGSLGAEYNLNFSEIAGQMAISRYSAMKCHFNNQYAAQQANMAMLVAKRREFRASRGRYNREQFAKGLYSISVAYRGKPAAVIPPKAPQFAPWKHALITRVIDGDTVEVVTGGKLVKVRLYGIDCPEMDQPFGSEARDLMQTMVGKAVEMRVMDIDRYGRTVAILRPPGFYSLNEAMVARGMAWWYDKYSPNDRRLSTLQASAKSAGVGVWSQDVPPAWEHRNGLAKAEVEVF